MQSRSAFLYSAGVALASLCFVLPSKAKELCLGPSAVEAAQQLFSAHRDFAFVAPNPRLHSPELVSALQLETERVNVTQGICSLNGDPWTGAQDGTVLGPAHAKLVKMTSSGALVQVRFALSLEERPSLSNSTTREAMAFLWRRPSSKCWLVDDLMAQGSRLRTTLRESAALVAAQKSPSSESPADNPVPVER